MEYLLIALIVITVLFSLGALLVVYCDMRNLWDREQEFYTGCFDDSPVIRWWFKSRIKSRNNGI